MKTTATASADYESSLAIADAETVNISYPGFYDDLRNCAGK